MVRFALAMAVVLLVSPLAMGAVDGQRSKDQVMVNIEAFKYFEIGVGEGSKVRIDARIESLSYPVSVFLIKGDEEFERFVATDSVNVDDIRKGNISDLDVSFKVVSGFSQPNTELFEGAITIGEPDTYYLVIMLYRDSSMDPESVLTSRATLVNYDIGWSEVEKDVPYYLLPIALVLSIVGAGLLIYYFWPRAPTSEDAEGPEGAVRGRPRMARVPPATDGAGGPARRRVERRQGGSGV